MSSDEEKLDDGANQEMESDVELTDLEDEVREEMNADDDDDGTTSEVKSTHSSLDGINSSNDDSSDDECRAIKPPKPAAPTPKRFKQSYGDQAEKEDTDEDENDDELLGHSSLDNVSSSSSSDSDVDYKPGSALLPKNKIKNKPSKGGLLTLKKAIKTQLLCPQCDYCTVSKRHLDDHLLKRHKIHRSQLPGSNIYPTSNRFKCEICSRTYKWKQSLLRHMRLDDCGSKLN